MDDRPIVPIGGTPIDRQKILSVSQMRRRARPGVQEGRSHPSTGKPYKSVTNELGGTVTEHATKDDRVDVQIKVAPIALKVTAKVAARGES